MTLRVLLVIFILFPFLSDGQPQGTVTSYRDTSACYSPFVKLDAGHPGATYTWSNGDTSRQINVSFPGIYTVKISEGNTDFIDSINVRFPFNNAYNNRWMFRSGGSVCFNLGKQPASATEERALERSMNGCVSDEDGRLWIYSDGVNLYNRYHEVIQNSDSLVYGAAYERDVHFCHFPGKDSLFFLFVLPESFGTVYYSVVDMTRNGGKGSVTSRNIALTPTDRLMLNEAVAIRHENLKHFWLVLKEHGSADFLSFLITESGINPAPLRISAGSQTNATFSFKSSPQGNAIVYFDSFHDEIHLVVFNPATGTVSLPVVLTGESPRAAEFSPDGSKLYVTVRTSLPTQTNAYTILQYDLSVWSASQISQSKKIIGTMGPGGVHDMALGADGRVYVINDSIYHFGIIHYPDLPGASCHYVQDGLYMEDNFVSPYFPPPVLPNYQPIVFSLTGPSLLCHSGDSITYYISGRQRNVPEWAAEGYAQIVKKTDSSLTVKVHSPGTIKINATIKSCTESVKQVFTTEVKDMHFSLGKDTLVCGSLKDYVLAPGEGFTSYLWQDNSPEHLHKVTGAGTYWVRVRYKECEGADTVHIDQARIPFLDFKDTSICEGDTLLLDAGEGYESYLWQDGSASETYQAALPGKYSVFVSNACGTAEDSLTLSVKPVPVAGFTGLNPSYCFSRDPVYLQGMPSGGIFEGKSIKGNTFIPSSAAYGENVITYHYTNSYGCSASESQVTQVHDACLFIPDLITVNNDSLNDAFEIKGLPDGSMLEIFDRWGKRVYKNENYNREWQAGGLSSGIYYYHLSMPATGKHRNGWIHVMKE